MQNKGFGKDGVRSVRKSLFISMSGPHHQIEEQRKFKKLANKETSLSTWQTRATLPTDLILNVNEVAALTITVGRPRPKRGLADFQIVVVTTFRLLWVTFN